ncbi:MAG: hypothetical protein L0H75_11870, partial [Nitrosospira sp.]|nr:hypothetical protein [Nitrosospira sp.]
MTANKNTFDSYRIIEESMMAAGAEAVAAGSPLSSADPRTFLSRMSGRQKLVLMLAVSVIIALLAGGWMWRQAPDYKVLFSNISGHDGGAIIASLQQMNVPYQYADGGGAILV